MADYIVTGPDGAKYKITADNDEAVNHAVTQMFGAGHTAAPTMPGGDSFTIDMGKSGSAPAAAPAVAPEPSMWDKVVDAGKGALDFGAQLAVGGRKGLTSLAGLPVDAAAAVTNAGIWAANKATGANIPYATDPVGGGRSLDRLVTAPGRTLGFEDPVPQGPAGRIAQRVGEELGAVAVPVGAGLRLGARGVEAARELPTLARMFAEPAAVNPGKFIQREAGAGVAAGTGAGVVNEATDAGLAKAANKPLTGGQVAGDVGGAVGGVGLAAIGSTAGRTAGHLYTALRGKSTNQANEVIRDVATDEIARAAGLAPGKDGTINTVPLADTIDHGRQVADTIPGFQESTADRTKNAGLAAMEYGRQTGPNSGTYAARRTANTEAVDAAMRPMEPQATPGAFSDELATVRDRRLNDAAMGRAAAEDEAARATSTLQPQGTPAMRGSTIRNELETAQTTAQQETARAYEAAGINDNPMPHTALAQALDEVTETLPMADRTLTPQGLIDRVAQLPAGEPATLREATALKTHLLGLQEKAAAEPGGRNTVRVLGEYLDAVEGVIRQHVTPEQSAALDAARVARRAEGDAFERRGDPVAEILSTRQGGQPKLRDDSVAQLATRDDAMARILEQADTPATRTAIRNQLLSNADTATAAGLHDFQQRYAQQIARFPGLNDELGGAVRARVSENTARGAEGGLMKEIGEGGRGVVAKYLQYGDENANKAMSAVLAHKDPARAADELLTFVGDDPKAVEGARKVFWDLMQKKTRSDGSTTKTINGTQPYLPAALRRFTEDPATAAVAERLYRDNPEHWDRIKEITKAMQGVDVRNSAKAPNTSGTAQGVQNGILPTGETVASRVFAVQRGVVSPTFAAVNIAGIIARKAMKRANAEAIDKTIDKALLDPDFAALLLKENNPANRAAMRRATKGWQTHEASTIIQALEPDDKDAETKGAAMRGR